MNGGVRFIFRQSIRHKDYLFWLYEFFNNRGYTSNNLPIGYTQKSGDNLYIAYRFGTYYYTSFIWLYKLFYNNNKKKVIPKNIADYLTPLALAVWIMDDGTLKKPGVRIATNCFTLEEVELLKLALENKFNLKCSLAPLSPPPHFKPCPRESAGAAALGGERRLGSPPRINIYIYLYVFNIIYVYIIIKTLGDPKPASDFF